MKDYYKVKSEKLRSQAVMVAMTYEQIVAVANVLEYVYEKKLPDFPKSGLEPILTRVRDNCVNCALSLEAMEAENG